jgi:hypothetical protein
MRPVTRRTSYPSRVREERSQEAAALALIAQYCVLSVKGSRGGVAPLMPSFIVAHALSLLRG